MTSSFGCPVPPSPGLHLAFSGGCTGPSWSPRAALGAGGGWWCCSWSAARGQGGRSSVLQGGPAADAGSGLGAGAWLEAGAWGVQLWRCGRWPPRLRGCDWPPRAGLAFLRKTALESCHAAHLVSLFTLQALGSFYFLHESLKNIYQFDFKGKTPRCPLRPLGFSVLLDPARCLWSGFSRPLLPSVPATGLCVRFDRGFPRSQAGTWEDTQHPCDRTACPV